MATVLDSLLLLFLLLMASVSPLAHQVADNKSQTTATPMRPVAPAELGFVALNQTALQRRRRLNSFRVCALCTCCGGPRGLCVASPCCYAISCNIPNRPFGYCSFTPRSCNCFGCHL